MSKLDEIFKFTGISNAAKAGAIQDVKALFLELIGEKNDYHKMPDEADDYIVGYDDGVSATLGEIKAKVKEL